MSDDSTLLPGDQLKTLFLEFQAPVREAGSFIRSQVGKVTNGQIEVKSQNSLVSFVDKNAEGILVSQLKEMLPEAGFVTEEDTVQNREREYTWIIDPLDGTTNFLQNIPMFAVSVALYRGEEPVLGAVYDVMHDELFTAIDGGGAYLNGKRIHVSSTSLLGEAVIATGFPYDTKDQVDILLERFSNFLTHARGLRRLGAAALDLAYVACGRFDGFYEASLNPWDIAAGALIVREAGGLVTDFKGGRNFINANMIIASNKNIHNEMMPLLEKEHI